MTACRVELHPGVRISSADGVTIVTDEATGTRHALTRALPASAPASGAPPEVAVFLFANGLARADRPGARRAITAAGVVERAERRRILRWSAARRIGTGRAAPALLFVVLRALCRAWAPALLGAGGAGAVFAALLETRPADVVGFAAAPALFVVLVAVHEAAHWSAARHLCGPAAGALLLGPRVCCVVRPPTTLLEARGIALAGPVAGVLAAGGSAVVFHGSAVLVTVGVVFVGVNLLGLTPLTSDGRDILRSSPGLRRAPREAAARGAEAESPPRDYPRRR